MLDEIEVKQVGAFEKAYIEYLHTNKASAMDAIRDKKVLSDEVLRALKDAAKVVMGQFKSGE